MFHVKHHPTGNIPAYPLSGYTSLSAEQQHTAAVSRIAHRDPTTQLPCLLERLIDKRRFHVVWRRMYETTIALFRIPEGVLIHDTREAALAEFNSRRQANAA